MEIAIADAPALREAGDEQPNPVLEHELRLIGSAVALVEAGGAPRVTLVGMRSGGELVTRALAMGTQARLPVRARWWPEGDALDLVVEQHG